MIPAILTNRVSSLAGWPGDVAPLSALAGNGDVPVRARRTAPKFRGLCRTAEEPELLAA